MPSSDQELHRDFDWLRARRTAVRLRTAAGVAAILIARAEGTAPRWLSSLLDSRRDLIVAAMHLEEVYDL